MAIKQSHHFVAVYLSGTYIVDRMALLRRYKRNWPIGAMVAYSSTPAMGAGIFYAVPALHEGVSLTLWRISTWEYPVAQTNAGRISVWPFMISTLVIIILRFPHRFLLIISSIASPGTLSCLIDHLELNGVLLLRNRNR